MILKNKNFAKILVALAIGIITGIAFGYKQKIAWIEGTERYYFNTEMATISGLIAFSVFIILFFINDIFKK
jgi:Na+/H+-dicarboxylate symporter